jgi:hypothetical protein
MVLHAEYALNFRKITIIHILNTKSNYVMQTRMKEIYQIEGVICDCCELHSFCL